MMEDVAGELAPLHPCSREAGRLVAPNQLLFPQWQGLGVENGELRCGGEG